MSNDIDAITRELDSGLKELKPLQRNLDGLRQTRRDEQRLAKLKTAKDKMDTTGRIGLEDLQVLMKSGALDLGKEKGRNEEEERKRKEEAEKKSREIEERNRKLAEELRRKKEEEKKMRRERLEKRRALEEEKRKKS